MIILLLVCEICFAQKNVSTVEVGEQIIVTANINSFDSTKHAYDTCDTGFGWKAICLIDGKPWFGSDAGMSLPRNQIIKMSIKIKNKEVPLDVTGMFNANWNNELRKEQFKIQKTEVGYLLSAYFSDGAGTYGAKWLIIKNTSIRTIISNEENVIWEDEK
jgi:hypothetical protein